MAIGSSLDPRVPKVLFRQALVHGSTVCPAHEGLDLSACECRILADVSRKFAHSGLEAIRLDHEIDQTHPVRLGAGNLTTGENEIFRR